MKLSFSSGAEPKGMENGAAKDSLENRIPFKSSRVAFKQGDSDIFKRLNASLEDLFDDTTVIEIKFKKKEKEMSSRQTTSFAIDGN